MELKGVRELKKAAASANNGVVYAFGMNGGQTAFALAQVHRENGRQMLIAVPGLEKARLLRDYLEYFTGSNNIYILPDELQSSFRFDAKSRVLSNQRIGCVQAARTQEQAIFITPVMGLAKGMCSPSTFAEMELKLSVGLEAGVDLRSRLTEMGYERVSMTESQGQFSIRGEIVDVFPPGAEYPYRIDLFDTEVDNIKQFDPLSQRSVEVLQTVTIIPAALPLPEDASEASYFWDYLMPGALFAADDWDRIVGQRLLADKEWASAVSALEDTDSIPAREVLADMETIAAAMQDNNAVIATPFMGRLKYLDTQAALVDVNAIGAATFNGRMDLFADEVQRLLADAYQVHVICTTEERREALENYAQRNDIYGNIYFLSGSIPTGMYFTSDRVAMIADGDVFRSTKKKRGKKKKKNRKMATFADFKEGDYVVHENHGIGRYVGIKPMVVEEVRRDYIAISYAANDMLYVPVEQMDLVQPYIGSGGKAPKINRLSSPEWSKTKSKAKAAIEHMAEDLVNLSAERKMEKGHAFNVDSVWQNQFDDMFPYEETEDQLRAIDEIRNDMASSWPMDRLLCGDVGFGKTEVAARAIFTCVMDSKQAAMLVPTTILADQHYKSFLERFSNFPVTIECLSRFRTEEEQRRAIAGLKDGSVDVIIGTHRLLSKDVEFKDLGLLVIDEEQRFGVQHKEKIKMISKNVDVLSLSATPIPRTLHMSMSGIRGMSTLEEPPEERYPVQTFVLEQDDALIREAIMREYSRGGQTFVIFNRVKGINIIADKIRTLVPEVKVACAHGRMNENKLEEVMTDFIDGEYDVLVATTIVESGIDIKSANTLIVLDSDRYGLAQLYQLRGRVGRSDVPAYAYLMYQQDKVLTEVAEQRMRAIMEFTEFGSGFRVAMKDLELRGAGNLLGTEQSGHMMTIGYELYCKMIDDALRRLKGESVEEEEQEVLIEIQTDAYIPSNYITDENVRLDVYKRIAAIETENDMRDVADEMLDRFGDIPKPMASLMKVALLKAMARKAGMDRISLMDNGVRFGFPQGMKMDPEGFLRLANAYGNRIVMNMSKRPFIRMPVKKQRTVLNDCIALVRIFRGLK